MACPQEHELVELAEGRAGDRAIDLRAHIDECDDCRVVLARSMMRGSVPARAELEPVAGRYRLVRPIGKGGMGEVHEAWDLNLERRVALKMLVPRGSDRDDAERRIARLVRESKSMARLRHPNVVAVHDAGVWEGQAFVVMELVDGETLRVWCQRERSWQEVVAMFVAAGRGLQAANARGIVHRDFKPDNVLIGEAAVGPEGTHAGGEYLRAQVTDFGLARWLEEGAEPITLQAVPTAQPFPDSGSLTQTGTAVGTPAYMAPEQFRGHDVDARADVFAFCVSLYEALCGRRPFAGGSPRAIFDAQRVGANDEHLRAAAVPRWLRDAVLAGLAFDPAARPRDMTAMLRLLRPPAARSRKLVTAAGLAVVALAAGGAVWAGARTNDPCRDHDALAQVWNADARARTDDALAQRFDRWASGWQEAWASACASTDAEAGLRRSCLIGQRSAFVAMVEHAGKGELEVIAVEKGLPRLRDCAVDRDLALLRPEPDDPELAERVEVVRRDIEEIVGLQYAGQARDLDERVAAALASARQLGFRPLEAEALHAQGLQHLHNGRPLESRAALVEAAQVASASGHDSSAAISWVALVDLESDELHDLDRGHEYAANARAAIERLTGSSAVDELRCDLMFSYGKLLWQEGRTAEAKVQFREGQVLAQRVDPEMVDSMLEGLAVVLDDEGELDEGLKVHLELAQRRIERLGADHPVLVTSYANIASTYAMTGQIDRALEYAQKATAVAERSSGERHPNYALALHNEGELLRMAGRYDDALARLRQAEKLFEATSGPESFRVASAIMHEAGVLQNQGRFDESIALMRRSLELLDRIEAGRDTANAKMNLADVLREAGRPADALPYARAAVEELDKESQGSPEGAYGHIVLAEILLELGHADQAIPLLERAIEWCEQGNFLPHEIGLAKFVLARALDRPGGDRARIGELLDAAERAWRDAPAPWDPRRRQLAELRSTRSI
ncbi:MAG TPA: serine/threonine-protein kinase [Nannocystaceae bacterium]|nr:serine/threonine-protein kinase [Nannocystaceae bacterium]